MRIYLHIGPQSVGAERLQSVLDAKRGKLAQCGILYPRSPGVKNHTRLYLAATDFDHIDPLRFNRGFLSRSKQADLRKSVEKDLLQEIRSAKPDVLILSATQLGASLHRPSEVKRLWDMLSSWSFDIRVLAHVDDPARTLARHYGAQVLDGRAAPLSAELGIGENWWDECLAMAPKPDPIKGQFIETQAPPFWLDTAALVDFWDGAFGDGATTLRPYDPDLWASEAVTEEIRAAFEIDETIGKAQIAERKDEPSAAWIARGRQLNALLLQVLDTGKFILPRQMWRSCISEMKVGGAPIEPGSLAVISQRFAKANAKLAKANGFKMPKPPKSAEGWSEADPTLGFRATQYLHAFMYRINRATKMALKSRKEDKTRTEQAKILDISEDAKRVMSPLAVEKFKSLAASRFAPHNRLGALKEDEAGADFTHVPRRTLPKGKTGNVIVGCMKNEAPYIVEWVAYHRAIGVDTFLIYTNDCTDGTAEILDRLQAMGVLQHRDNSKWEGNSPQQHALNLAMEEPVVKNADWIIHIDVDEFMNVRCGNGTLEDFFDHAPDATNVAMTWRLFGHNQVTTLEDRFVIEQFDTCAPNFCPKPHTSWGFKTMFRNIGAYEKMSCHRPNKLGEGFRGKVKWVNGSGKDMTSEALHNGWRNSQRSIGYDLLQLNHYALRSAESFLIKRQRGRALHVDRSIGLNYWIRMDWSDAKDLTIKRNISRVRVEYDALLADDKLRHWHQRGMEWHRAKAQELRGIEEFRDLYAQAIDTKLNHTERAAYALALDLES